MNLTRGRIFRVAVQCRDLNNSNHDVGNTTCAMFKVEGINYFCKKIHICAMYFRLLSTTQFRELEPITNLEQTPLNRSQQYKRLIDGIKQN